MQNPLKDFLYFSRGERRGILVLISGIIIVLLSGYFYTFYRERQGVSEKEIRQQTAALKEYDAFIASIREKENERKQNFPRYPKKQSPSIVLTPFNPNTADSIAFRKLGLPGWMAKNILHYRSKGGKFRKAEDFRKVYGLTTEQYDMLSPYIYIAPADTARTMASLILPHGKADSVYKYPAGTIIELNSADTTELKKIPGIGSGIARLIVNYRQRLGGFYKIEQLKDIHLDYKQLQSWFNIQPGGIRPLNLNRTGIDRLRNHPYFNFYQAKAIVEYRKKKGVLNSLKPFALYEEFTEADLERISHYVCFE